MGNNKRNTRELLEENEEMKIEKSRGNDSKSKSKVKTKTSASAKSKKNKKLDDDEKVIEVDKVSLVLLILVIIEIFMVPVLVISGISKIIPVVMFLVLPTASVLIIYLLVRSVLKENKSIVKINNYSDNEDSEEEAELKRVEVTKNRIRRSNDD